MPRPSFRSPWPFCFCLFLFFASCCFVYFVWLCWSTRVCPVGAEALGLVALVCLRDVVRPIYSCWRHGRESPCGTRLASSVGKWAGGRGDVRRRLRSIEVCAVAGAVTLQ